MEQSLSEIIKYHGFDVVFNFGSPLSSQLQYILVKLGIIARLPCSVHAFPGHQLQTTV